MARTLLCAGALTAAILTAFPSRAAATTYEVGPGKTYANVGDVPLEALTAATRYSSTSGRRRTRRSSSSRPSARRAHP
jgi:hypothetical protein